MLKSVVYSSLRFFLHCSVTALVALGLVQLTARAQFESCPPNPDPSVCEATPECFSIDADGSGDVNPLLDALYLLEFGFLGGAPPQVCLASEPRLCTDCDDEFLNHGQGEVTAADLSPEIDDRYVNEGQQGSIVAGMIVPDSVTSIALAPESVGTAELALGAVNSGSILDGSISKNDLAFSPVQHGEPDSITPIMILDGSVAEADLAFDPVEQGEGNSVGSGMIINGSISAADIGANAVQADELADNAVDTNAIQAGAVNESKLSFDPTTQSELDSLAAQVQSLDASNIGFDPTGTGFDPGTTDVEAALLELDGAQGFQRVAFFAQLDTSNYPIPDSSTQELPFDDVILDTAGAYNTSTGRYTATVEGWYFFVVQVYFLGPMNANSRLQVNIDRNSGVDGNQDSDESVISTTAVPLPSAETLRVSGLYHLEVGDYVRIQCRQSNTQGDTYVLSRSSSFVQGFRVF